MFLIKGLPVGKNCTCTSKLILLQFVINRWLKRVYVLNCSLWITQFQSSSLFHLVLTGHLTYQECFSPPSHSRHHVVIYGTTCEVALQPRLRPLLPRCTISTTEGQLRCRSEPQRLPRPCKLWCLCPHQGPGCMLLSSPGHRSSQAGTRGAAGSAGRRRWQWGQSEVLQCHCLTKEKCKLWKKLREHYWCTVSQSSVHVIKRQRL